MNKKFLDLTKKAEDGTAIIPFKNKHGEVFGELRFNPNDIGIPGRFQKLREDIRPADEMLKRIHKINPDGTVPAWYVLDRKIVKDAEDTLKKDFDWCFGAGTYDSVFGKTRPFAKINDRFFCTAVIEAIDKSIFAQEEA